MDPVTIIGGATVAFNALKKGFQVGKDLQEMSGQLTQWAGCMSDLAYAEQKNKRQLMKARTKTINVQILT